MRNRGLRREFTLRKYISRVKKELPFILIKDGKTYNRYGHLIPAWRHPESYVEAIEKCKWVKLLKHGKVYGRSTMNNLEKHFKVKKMREDGKKLIREYVKVAFTKRKLNAYELARFEVV